MKATTGVSPASGSEQAGPRQVTGPLPPPAPPSHAPGQTPRSPPVPLCRRPRRLLLLLLHGVWAWRLLRVCCRQCLHVIQELPKDAWIPLHARPHRVELRREKQQHQGTENETSWAFPACTERRCLALLTASSRSVWCGASYPKDCVVITSANQPSAHPRASAEARSSTNA